MTTQDNGHTGMVCMGGVSGGREGTPQGRRRGRAPGGTGQRQRHAGAHGEIIVDAKAFRAGPNPLIDRRFP